MGRKEKVGVDLGLSDDEKTTLLKIARTTIESRIKGKDAPEFTPDSETLKETGVHLYHFTARVICAAVSGTFRQQNHSIKPYRKWQYLLHFKTPGLNP